MKLRLLIYLFFSSIFILSMNFFGKDLAAQSSSDESLVIEADKPSFKKKGKKVKEELASPRLLKIPDFVEATQGNPFTMKAELKIEDRGKRGKSKGKKGKGTIKCTYAHDSGFRSAITYAVAKLRGQNPSQKIPIKKCSKGYTSGDTLSAKKLSLRLESSLRVFRPAGSVQLTLVFADVTPPQFAVVPELIGLSKTLAEARLTEAGLSIGAQTGSHSDRPIDEVISQDPAAGTSVQQGSAVVLDLSIGLRTVSVPQLVGLSQNDAQALLAQSELGLGLVSEEFSQESIGEVLSQSPTSGVSVELGALVDLVVSKGLVVVTVPPLVGKDEQEAKSLLAQAGLTANIAYEYILDIPKGEVISQSPVAGSELEGGSEISLVVSNGPPVGFVGGDETITPMPMVLATQRAACIANHPISGNELPPGREATFYEKVAFIFTGNNPLQEGVGLGVC